METTMGEDDVKPTESAVKNWLLLEIEIKNVLKEDNWQIAENKVGDACIFPGDNDSRELNITGLAKVLAPRVLVRISPLVPSEGSDENGSV